MFATPSTSPGDSAEVPTANGAMFEGLVRMLRPTGPFASELLALGFDVNRIKNRYPVSMLVAALDVSARNVYPNLPREAAHHELGRRFVDAYFQTLLGRVGKLLMQMLGLERFLLQQYTSTASATSTGTRMDVQKVAPGDIRITVHSSQPMPDFVAGTLVGVSALLSTEATVEIVRRDSTGYEIKVLLPPR